MVPHFDEGAVRRRLTWGALIPAMERCLAAFSQGKTITPLRSMITIEEGKRYVGVMPAVVDGAIGVKVVTFFPGNSGSAHPTHMAMILLFDAQTGAPIAVMDGRLITEMRTAAVSAAVTDRLAAKESRVLTLLGSGVQAKAHLEALSSIRHFGEVRVWSRNPDHARRFAQTHGVRAFDDAESAVRGADVIVTATSSITPVLRGEWLREGAHVNAIGAPRPGWRELDDAAMSNAVVVDSREAARAESGDVILSGASIYAEAGEIFSGTRPIPRGTTIFKSLGIAVEDAAAAKLVYLADRKPDQ